jgi:hypothetical protein
MTFRLLLLLALACCIGTARAVDLRTLPPMNETKMSPDVELKGREVEAIEVALRQFRENHYSTSGDLKHFTVELRREGSKLFVSFLPEMHEPSHRITPARNKYGIFITYAVSLRTLKIIGYHYERD